MKTLFNKIDKQILLNYPQIWATQLHSFLFGYAILMGLALLIAFIYPISAANVPDSEVYFVYPLIVSGITFLIWLYRASWFKISTQFGNMSPAHSFKMQLVYLLIVSMLAILPYSFVQVMSFRVKHLVSNEQFRQDLYALNECGYQKFEIYVMADNFIPQKNEGINLLKLEKHIQTIYKYGGSVSKTAQEIYEVGGDIDYISDNYHVSENISLISKAKEGKVFFQESEFYWITSVWIFVFTFLSFIILATSFKTFLLSVLTGIIGSMLTGLLSAFSSQSSGSSPQLFMFLFLIIVGMLYFYGIAGGNTGFGLRSREIALSLAMAFTPFVPLDFLGMIMADSELKGGNDENIESFLKIIFVLSVVFTWVVWQKSYLPTLKKIQAEPMKF